MVFQYTGALPSSNMVHEGRVNLKERNSQIHHNHDSTSENIRQWLFIYFFHLCPCFVFLPGTVEGWGVCVIRIDRNPRRQGAM